MSIYQCSLTFMKSSIKGKVWWTNQTHSLPENYWFSIPVCGVWHIDIPGRELQDLPGGTNPAVWVWFNLQEVRGQAIVGVLRSWRDVQLQLGCFDSHGRQGRKREGNNQCLTLKTGIPEITGYSIVCCWYLWWVWVSSELKKVFSYQLRTCTSPHHSTCPPPSTNKQSMRQEWDLIVS